MSAVRHTFSPDRLRRLFAAACAALVFALTVFAASPVAHEWLHVDGVSQADDDCAVTLFASGVSLPVGPVHITPPVEAGSTVSPATAAELFLVSPRYLRQPERGPPANWVS
jgi:hypothetical protein